MIGGLSPTASHRSSSVLLGDFNSDMLLCPLGKLQGNPGLKKLPFPPKKEMAASCLSNSELHPDGAKGLYSLGPKPEEYILQEWYPPPKVSEILKDFYNTNVRKNLGNCK